METLNAPSVLFLPVLFLGLLAILATVFWIWMLVDCALHEPSEGNDKLVWVVIILFTHALGAIIYFLVRRPKRPREGEVNGRGARCQTSVRG